MGLSADRGITQIAGSDIVKTLWQKLNLAFDNIVALIPYRGTDTGTTDSGGNATITHGLGFTPSSVFVVSRMINSMTAQASICVGVDTITATTFRCRFLTIDSDHTESGVTKYTIAPSNVLPYNIAFQAFR